MSYPRSWSGFGGGRVSLRVAISNRRLIAFDETGVTFRYKNYRRDGPERQRVMTFAPHESIRRFLPHVLPHGFHRIHHYSLLASSNREANVARARELLAVAPSPKPVALPELPDWLPPSRARTNPSSPGTACAHLTP
jgi:hypothetical protein